MALGGAGPGSRPSLVTTEDSCPGGGAQRASARCARKGETAAGSAPGRWLPARSAGGRGGAAEGPGGSGRNQLESTVGGQLPEGIPTPRSPPSGRGPRPGQPQGDSGRERTPGRGEALAADESGRATGWAEEGENGLLAHDRAAGRGFWVGPGAHSGYPRDPRPWAGRRPAQRRPRAPGYPESRTRAAPMGPRVPISSASAPAGAQTVTISGGWMDTDS